MSIDTAAARCETVSLDAELLLYELEEFAGDVGALRIPSFGEYVEFHEEHVGEFAEDFSGLEKEWGPALINVSLFGFAGEPLAAIDEADRKAAAKFFRPHCIRFHDHYLSWQQAFGRAERIAKLLNFGEVWHLEKTNGLPTPWQDLLHLWKTFCEIRERVGLNDVVPPWHRNAQWQWQDRSVVSDDEFDQLLDEAASHLGLWRHADSLSGFTEVWTKSHGVKRFVRPEWIGHNGAWYTYPPKWSWELIGIPAKGCCEFTLANDPIRPLNLDPMAKEPAFRAISEVVCKCCGFTTTLCWIGHVGHVHGSTETWTVEQLWRECDAKPAATVSGPTEPSPNDTAGQASSATQPSIEHTSTRTLMKGRPLTVEEFERMTTDTALAKAIVKHNLPGEKPQPDSSRYKSWRHLLEGLWLGGLRIGEAMNLSWDDPTKLVVETSLLPHVFLRIAHGGQKAKRDELLPIAPEFAEFLLKTPESRRRGFVFNPRGQRETGRRLSQKQAEKIIARIGAAANIVTDPVDARTATAHDLRRSFGDRWSARVMPATLQVLMRHKSIQTTLKYYAGRKAETVAKELQAAIAHANQTQTQVLIPTNT